MDFDRRWTAFALGAEADTYGFVRIAQAHNAALVTRDERIAELEAKLARLRPIARAAVEWEDTFSVKSRNHLCALVLSLSEPERSELLEEATEPERKER